MTSRKRVTATVATGAGFFLVDKHDELWIIDLGGSYTECWVEPRISDTLEGDEQGLEKVKQALKNPDDENVPHGHSFDRSKTPNPSAIVKETASSLFVTEAPKRKRSSVGNGEGRHGKEDGEDVENKR